VLRQLARHRRIILGIVSGRRRAELLKYVNEPRAKYLGLHGWEQRERSFLPGKAQSLLLRAQRMLTQPLGKLPGIRIEDKEFSFAVHYRGAPPDVVRRARTIIRDILIPLEPDLRLLEGKKIWEVLPREVEGKGAAVCGALKALPRSSLPIYVGDDITDESAFAVLPRGITVRVGRARHTKARYKLRNPDEVRDFLERLEVELS